MANMTKSSRSVKKNGNSVQPLEQGVALPFSTSVDNESLMLILTCVLRSWLLEPFQSSDTIYLAFLRAKDMAIELGIEESAVTEVLVHLSKFRDGDNNVKATRGFMG